MGEYHHSEQPEESRKKEKPAKKKSLMSDAKVKALVVGLGTVAAAYGNRHEVAEDAHKIAAYFKSEDKSAIQTGAPDAGSAEDRRAEEARIKFNDEREKVELDRKGEAIKEAYLRQTIKKEWGIDIKNIHEESRDRFGMFIVNPLDQQIVLVLRKRAEEKSKSEDLRRKIIARIAKTADEEGNEEPIMSEAEADAEMVAKLIEAANKDLLHMSYSAPTEADIEMMHTYAGDLGNLLGRVGIGRPEDLKDIDFTTSTALQTEPFRSHVAGLLKAVVGINQRLLLLKEGAAIKTKRVEAIATAEKMLKAMRGGDKVSGK